MINDNTKNQMYDKILELEKKLKKARLVGNTQYNNTSVVSEILKEIEEAFKHEDHLY